MAQAESGSGDSPVFRLHTHPGTIADSPPFALHTTTLTEVGDLVLEAAVLRIESAFPDPFSETQRIRFRLAASAAVDVRVLDLNGRLVRELLAARGLASGQRELEWDGRDAAGRRVTAGVYYLQLRTATESVSRRMTRLR